MAITRVVVVESSSSSRAYKNYACPTVALASGLRQYMSVKLEATGKWTDRWTNEQADTASPRGSIENNTVAQNQINYSYISLQLTTTF